MAVRIMRAGLFTDLHIYASACIFMRMNDSKEQRQRVIAGLIRSSAPSSQEEVAEHLSRLGYAVTQATVSRDLEQLGAVKVRIAGELSYALPDQIGGAPPPRIAAIFRDWVRSVEPAANLVVIKTPPGSAHLVGVALDNSEILEIAGTICGDDTIFVACRSEAEAKALSAKLSGELQ
jgi:transcriptional regulator of arginine metabolism